MKIVGAGAYFYEPLPASVRTVRMGGHWYPYLGFGLNAPLLKVMSGVTEMIEACCIAVETREYELQVETVQQDTEVGTFAAPDQFYHVALCAKIDPAAGWVSFYVDGVKMLTFTGDTGDVDVDAFRFHGGYGGSTAGYWDDCYIDVDLADEEVDECPPDRRFDWVPVDGIGDLNDWTPEGSATHYENVDERPHSGDTDYNEVDTLDDQDSYDLDTVTIPTGGTMEALIPCGYFRKTNAATGSQVAVGMRDVSDNDVVGDAQDVASSYGAPRWQRYDVAPDAGAWTQADLDDLELLVTGKGDLN
jgi:hypothetical protein